MKILALDFNGILADNQFECLFVGFNAYLELNKDTNLFNSGKTTLYNFNRIKNNYKKTL